MRSASRSRHSIAKNHLDKKITFRLRIFLVVFIVMTAIVGFDIFTQSISFWLGLVGLLIGVLVGFLTGRMYKHKWHEDSQKVVSQIDLLGVFIIAIYILFSIFRRAIFGHFIQADVLSAFTFAILAGSMLGRVLSTGYTIRKILTTEGII